MVEMNVGGDSASKAPALSGMIDHVALQVPDLDRMIGFLEEECGMHLKRRGIRHATGGRMAMVGDASGMKLELIEEAESDGGVQFLHVAFRSGNVVDDQAALAERGLGVVKEPVYLESAKAWFAMCRHGLGMDVQVANYDAESPDL